VLLHPFALGLLATVAAFGAFVARLLAFAFVRVGHAGRVHPSETR
jgi:hypothetical protein